MPLIHQSLSKSLQSFCGSLFIVLDHLLCKVPHYSREFSQSICQGSEQLRVPCSAGLDSNSDLTHLLLKANHSRDSRYSMLQCFSGGFEKNQRQKQVFVVKYYSLLSHTTSWKENILAKILNLLHSLTTQQEILNLNCIFSNLLEFSAQNIFRLVSKLH